MVPGLQDYAKIMKGLDPLFGSVWQIYVCLIYVVTYKELNNLSKSYIFFYLFAFQDTIINVLFSSCEFISFKFVKYFTLISILYAIVHLVETPILFLRVRAEEILDCHMTKQVFYLWVMFISVFAGMHRTRI